MSEEKINQILKNQATILLALAVDTKDLEVNEGINRRMEETLSILNPIKEPTIAEKTEFAFGRVSE